jgi:hypothetical protein
MFVCRVHEFLRFCFHLVQDGSEVTVYRIDGGCSISLANSSKRPDQAILPDFQHATTPNESREVRIGLFLIQLIAGSFHRSFQSVIASDSAGLNLISPNAKKPRFFAGELFSICIGGVVRKFHVITAGLCKVAGPRPDPESFAVNVAQLYCG